MVTRSRKTRDEHRFLKFDAECWRSSNSETEDGAIFLPKEGRAKAMAKKLIDTFPLTVGQVIQDKGWQTANTSLDWAVLVYRNEHNGPESTVVLKHTPSPSK